MVADNGPTRTESVPVSVLQNEHALGIVGSEKGCQGRGL